MPFTFYQNTEENPRKIKNIFNITQNFEKYINTTENV